MYVSLVEFGTPAYAEMIYLRDLVLRKPLGLQFEAKDLATEYSSFHFAAFDNDGEVVGALVMVPLDNGQIKMRQVAVHPDIQRRGVGQLMVLASETYSICNNFKEIVLSARVPAVPFYKQLGYKVVSELYQEVGIDHFKMSKKL